MGGSNPRRVGIAADDGIAAEAALCRSLEDIGATNRHEPRAATRSTGDRGNGDFWA